jgi:NO-binding membrane sensor protein with MHYT domain
VHSPPLAFTLLSDGRLLLLAMSLAAVASFVSLSIFGYASRGRAHRRAGWFLLAAVCSAFGLWAAHFIALLSHRADLPGAIEAVLTVAAHVGVAGIMWCGFAIAAKGMRWDAPIGGAINGTGMGIMHYLGMYAIAVPGFLEWSYPLVLASLGLGVGLNSAAMTVYQWRKGVAATWLATGLLTLAFLALHVTGMQAAHFVSGLEVAATSNGPLQWMLAAVAAGTVLAVLLLGGIAMLIDRQTMHDNVQIMQQLVDAAIEGIVVAKNDRIVSVNRRVAELCSVPRGELIGKSVSRHLIDKPIETAGEALLRTSLGRARARERGAQTPQRRRRRLHHPRPHRAAGGREGIAVPEQSPAGAQGGAQIAQPAARHGAHAHVAGPVHVRQGAACGRLQ